MTYDTGVLFGKVEKKIVIVVKKPAEKPAEKKTENKAEKPAAKS